MLTGIDISNWQKGFNLAKAKPGFCIVKATEGTNYVDKSCDGFVSVCQRVGIPFGFYHFANGSTTATQQARFFEENTRGYEKKGIPVLDFENAYGSSWIDKFVREYYAITGVFPWVYMNSDFVNNKGYGTEYAKRNCGLWLAGYPGGLTTYPAGTECPYKHPGWTLAAWQFTDKLKTGGMTVDGNVFYGDANAWTRYATGKGATSDTTPEGDKWHLARQVLNGVFGNGEERRKNLGTRYDEVQACVRSLLYLSDTALARLVINGDLSAGNERRYILDSRYDAVQRKVNELLSK